MSSEIKAMMPTALGYLKAALKDLEWEASLQNWEPEGFNHHTNGTPSFDSSEELKNYLYEMKEFIDQFEGLTEQKKPYRVIVPYQEMIAGRMIYHVDAGNAQEAIELVDNNREDVYETIVDGSIGQYEEHWDQVEAEER